MSNLPHIAFALSSIVLIFLSNIDTKVCLIVLTIYLYLFSIRNYDQKLRISAWIIGSLIAIASLNAYKFSPHSTKHLHSTVQGTKEKNWSKARENFSKIYSECTHCVLKYENYPHTLNKESLVLSYNEKSNSYKSMMDVIHKVHKDIPEDKLFSVLFQKSARELNGIGERIKGQNERASLQKELQLMEASKANTVLPQKRIMASSGKIMHPKLFFKKKNHKAKLKNKNLKNTKSNLENQKKRLSLSQHRHKKVNHKKIARTQKQY